MSSGAVLCHTEWLSAAGGHDWWPRLYGRALNFGWSLNATFRRDYFLVWHAVRGKKIVCFTMWVLPARVAANVSAFVRPRAVSDRPTNR